jgi:hypothetical protein
MPDSFLISRFLTGLGKDYAQWREDLAQKIVLVAKSAEDVPKLARFETVMVAAMAQEQKMKSAKAKGKAKLATSGAQKHASSVSSGSR